MPPCPCLSTCCLVCVRVPFPCLFQWCSLAGLRTLSDAPGSMRTHMCSNLFVSTSSIAIVVSDPASGSRKQLHCRAGTSRRNDGIFFAWTRICHPTRHGGFSSQPSVPPWALQQRARKMDQMLLASSFQSTLMSVPGFATWPADF